MPKYVVMDVQTLQHAVCYTPQGRDMFIQLAKWAGHDVQVVNL